MEKLRIKGSELVTDIRMGMTDAELIAKHSLSHNLLDRAFDLLVEANRISREELKSRKSGLKPSRVTPTNIVSSIPKSIGSDSRQSGRQRQEQDLFSAKTPINWALEPLKKYAVFKGRARRKEFWSFFLFFFIAFILLTFIGSILLGTPSGYIWLFWGPFFIVTFVPGWAVTFRRLHDTGRSGWWVLMNFVPIVGDIVLLIFLMKDSQPGENQYGPIPKATTV